jgi:hypothetical protein
MDPYWLAAILIWFLLLAAIPGFPDRLKIGYT